MRTILATIALALLPLDAIADGRLEDLSSDQVVEAAVLEIHSFNTRELEAAIEYVAACIERVSTERKYHCNRHFTITSIKIKAAPHFEKLRKAIFLAEVRSETAKGGDPFASIGDTMFENRRSSVLLRLQDAVRERYQSINR